MNIQCRLITISIKILLKCFAEYSNVSILVKERERKKKKKKKDDDIYLCDRDNP